MKKTNDPNKKSKQQKLPLQCAICGQKSRFKYYNVQSCESCKQFFRRIVMKQKEFHCLKFWTCDFLQGERCRGCRLDKCLSLGMDPSMVNVQMTEKLQDFIIKLEKRRRKLLDPNYSKYKIEATGPGSEQSGECSTSAEQEELLDKDEEQEIEDVDCRIQLMKSEESGLQLQTNWSPINTEMKIQNSPPWRIEPSLQQLGSLLQTEEKIRRIHYSCTELPPSYLDKCTTIGELIQRMDNLLSSAKQFSQQPTKHWIRPYVLASVQKNGIWGRKPVFFIRDLILSIDFARTLPVFNRLTLEDQISLVSSFALSASRMIISFYSMERNSQTIILPNGMPIAEQFKCSLRLAADPILESMSRKVYDRTVMNLKKVAPTKEEFILLLQLLFLDSAISGLTQGAQRLLKEEAEKCGKALLFLQQSRFGDQAGAQRYMETLSLVWHSNTNSRSYREFLVYLDAIYEQGQFEKAMPKMLSSICMLGPRELPSLPEGL